MSDIDFTPAGTSANTPRVIESASASTACQTCDSKFAYILTGSVLGVIALIMMALALLLVTAIGAWDRSGSYGWGDGQSLERYYGYGDGWDDDDFGWSSVPGDADSTPRAL